MHIIILGAGIIGVTTAYELIKSGYKVTIIDRNSKPAFETSYGNAGLIAPGHSYSWTTPKLPKNIFYSLFNKHKTFRLKFKWDLDLWRWGIQFLYQCKKEKMIENTLRKHRLSIYSQKLLHQITDETGISYFQKNNGLIYIFRSKESLDEGCKKLKIIQPIMNNIKILNNQELYKLEPALQYTQSKIFGGIFCPTDETGSCYDFTIKLANICKNKGVSFHYNTKIEKIIVNKNKVEKVKCNTGEYIADKYILACASNSALIAKGIGDYLPIYPVKGYSFTVPIVDLNKAPTHSGIDEDNFLAFSILGDKIRFTSIAEISGYDTSFSHSDFQQMIDISKSLFPNVFDYSNIEYWAGLRPMTPNGSPILGKGKISNLYYNTGHGHLGWTMCAGSARILKDLIKGEKNEIDLEGMLIN